MYGPISGLLARALALVYRLPPGRVRHELEGLLLQAIVVARMAHHRNILDDEEAGPP